MLLTAPSLAVNSTLNYFSEKMYNKTALFLILVLFASLVAAEEKSCLDGANTQLEMNMCAGSDAGRVEQELNDVYQQILKKYVGSPQFLHKLKLAQRAWLAFREAELQANFPLAKPELNYGSVYSMCVAGVKTRITAERIKELRKWLEPVEEGDICQGSVGNFKEETTK